MDIDLIELWSNMNALVRGVVVVLTLQALSGIYVVIDRLILLISSGVRSETRCDSRTGTGSGHVRPSSKPRCLRSPRCPSIRRTR